MDKQQDLEVMKARSYRSVLQAGFVLYMERFRQFFKASWLVAAVLAVLYGAVGALVLIMYPASLRPLIMLVVMPLVLPAVYELIRRAVKLNRSYWFTPTRNLKARLKHIGLLLVVSFSSLLLVMLASCIVLIPAVILCLANQSALRGMLIGDPSGMPPYMTGLTFFTFVLTAFIQFYVSQVMLVHKYYANGSIDAQEADRQKNNLYIE